MVTAAAVPGEGGLQPARGAVMAMLLLWIAICLPTDQQLQKDISRLLCSFSGFCTMYDLLECEFPLD